MKSTSVIMSHNPVEFDGNSESRASKFDGFIPRFLKRKRSGDGEHHHVPGNIVHPVTEDDDEELEMEEEGEISMDEMEEEEGEGEGEHPHRLVNAMEEELVIKEGESDTTNTSSTFRREDDVELEEVSLVRGERRGFLSHHAKKLKRKIERGRPLQRGRDLLLIPGRQLRRRVRRKRRAQVYTDRHVQSQPVYDYFWSQNLERETKWYEDCYGICFPCCVGNPCSRVRLKDYFRLITSFILWVSIAEIVYLCVEIGFGVHPLSMFYHPNPTRLSLILIKLGGKYTYGIKVKYEIYRLVSAIFMHSDLVHLIFNLLVQFSLALGYEKNWKIYRMALIYILSGVAGNLLSSVIYPSVITVGASGSLLGVILAKFANVICRWAQFTMNERFIHICSILFIVIITGIMSFSPTVDWGSHLGGGVMGFILGMGLFCYHISRKEIRIAVLLMSLFASIFFFLSVIIIFVFYTHVENFEGTED